ncbi:hypothetical protein ACIQ6U_11210 [Lysinibacillus fusiformis]|uniref:hypothetical protein n=1 Tax=Lysinibacillus fusiformis TaxID=28031 RepID=UPI003817FE2A
MGILVHSLFADSLVKPSANHIKRTTQYVFSIVVSLTKFVIHLLYYKHNFMRPSIFATVLSNEF